VDFEAWSLKMQLRRPVPDRRDRIDRARIGR
jgi:hypothetical protein